MSEQWKMQDEDGHGQGDGSGADAPGEEGAGGPKIGLKISTNTLFLVGAFAIALTMIWALGKQAGPRTAAAADGSNEKVDSAIREILEQSGKGDAIDNLMRRTDELVRLLCDHPGSKSPPVEELPCNPFEHLASGGTPDPIPLAAINPSIAQEARLRKLADSFKSLKLQTILVSKQHSAALINNRMVMVGGKIGEFTVADIQPERVILGAGGVNFELKPALPAAGRGQPPDDQ